MIKRTPVVRVVETLGISLLILTLLNYLAGRTPILPTSDQWALTLVCIALLRIERGGDRG